MGGAPDDRSVHFIVRKRTRKKAGSRLPAATVLCQSENQTPAAWAERAADPALGEDRALALLKHADLPGIAIESLAKNPSIQESRRVRLRICGHPQAPHTISRRLLRSLYTFDLLQLSQTPSVAGDIRRAAEDLLIRKLESLALGERIALARRCSGRIAAALLFGQPDRVQHIALENPRMTETLLLAVLRKPKIIATQLPGLVHAILSVARWQRSREVQQALAAISNSEGIKEPDGEEW